MASLDLFSDKSDLYALARPSYPQALYEFLSACVTTKEKVWDCATGNGQAAIDLANIFNEVYATDLSEQQIAEAPKNPKVTFSVQSAETTNFPDKFFDLVTAAQALHWFEFEKFWPEVLRVLKPGGVFAAWGYDWCKVEPDIDAVIDDTIMKTIAPFWTQQNHLLWRGYQDIEFPFEKITTPAIEMNQHWNLPQMLNYMHSWSATRKCMQVQGSGFFESAAEEIKKVWGDSNEVKEIKMNFHLYVGRH